MAVIIMPAPVVSSRAQSDALQVGGDLVTPTFAPISTNQIGDQTIVAAVAGKQIRVLAYSVVVNAAVVLTWKSSVAGAISGPMSFAANGGIAPPYAPVGILQTVAGEALVLNLSVGVSIGGSVTYILV